VGSPPTGVELVAKLVPVLPGRVCAGDPDLLSTHLKSFVLYRDALRQSETWNETDAQQYNRKRFHRFDTRWEEWGTLSVSSGTERAVNTRTSPLRKRAPEGLIAGKDSAFCAYQPT
jgi:hypothetical protein